MSWAYLKGIRASAKIVDNNKSLIFLREVIRKGEFANARENLRANRRDARPLRVVSFSFLLTVWKIRDLS